MNARTMVDAAAFAPPPPAKVGPHAIIQLADVIRDRCGDAGAHAVFRAAGQTRYLLQPPTRMTDESQVAALHHALWRVYPAEAFAMAAAAGERTAEYLMAEHIPASLQWLLRILPAGPAARLLVRAMARHAWTFSGSGRFTAYWGTKAGEAALTIEIADNPLATPDCPWHQSVFVRLFRRLVSANATVRHSRCCARGRSSCRFEIDW